MRIVCWWEGSVVATGQRLLPSCLPGIYLAAYHQGPDGKNGAWDQDLHILPISSIQAAGWPLNQSGFRESEIWQLLILVQQTLRIPIHMQYCPGHAGIIGNERADKLAGKGSDMWQQGLPLDQATANAVMREQRKQCVKQLNGEGNESKNFYETMTHGKGIPKNKPNADGKLKWTRKEEHILAYIHTMVVSWWL